MNDLRADLAAELRTLLEQWTALQSNPASTQRDYVRIKAKIDAICNTLDIFDGKANV